MDKTVFLNKIKAEGIKANMVNNIPTAYSEDLNKMVRAIRELAKTNSYNESFGIKPIDRYVESEVSA